jgi:hypothetical protein
MRPNCDVQRNEAPGFAHSSRLEKNQHKGTESSKASSSCLGSSLLGGRLLRRCGLLGSSSLLGGSLGLGISLWCGGGGGLGLGDTSGLCLAENTGYLSLDGISSRGGGGGSSLAGLAGVCLGLSSRGSLLRSGLCRCGLLLSCLLGSRSLLGLLIYSLVGKVLLWKQDVRWWWPWPWEQPWPWGQRPSSQSSSRSSSSQPPSSRSWAQPSPSWEQQQA